MMVRCPKKSREAVKILHDKYPAMVVDGEMQANFAINSELLSDKLFLSQRLMVHLPTH